MNFTFGQKQEEVARERDRIAAVTKTAIDVATSAVPTSQGVARLDQPSRILLDGPAAHDLAGVAAAASQNGQPRPGGVPPLTTASGTPGPQKPLPSTAPVGCGAVANPIQEAAMAVAQGGGAITGARPPGGLAPPEPGVTGIGAVLVRPSDVRRVPAAAPAERVRVPGAAFVAQSKATLVAEARAAATSSPAPARAHARPSGGSR